MIRENCPCCGYPTLKRRGNYEICLLCDWEDDGQENLQAAEVWAGPNGDYSLKEARNNFEKNLVMYRNNKGKHAMNRIDKKNRLMKAYEKLEGFNEADEKEKWNEILILEKELKESL